MNTRLSGPASRVDVEKERECLPLVRIVKSGRHSLYDTVPEFRTSQLIEVRSNHVDQYVMVP